MGRYFILWLRRNIQLALKVCKKYDYFTSVKGRERISKGWKEAKICGLMDGTTELPPEYPLNKPIICHN